MSTITVLHTYLVLSIKVYISNALFTRKLLHAVLRELQLPPDCLSKKQRKKIHFYTMQSCMVSSWTCALRGYRLSRTERLHATYLGIITPILDDLTDEQHMSTEQIFALLKQNDATANGTLLLARYLYGKLHDRQRPFFNAVFERTLRAQEESIRQFDTSQTLGRKELQEITRNKGGLATLLYRVVLDNPLLSGEEEAFMALGYAMQQINDMFDVHKDVQNGQQTLYTNTSDLSFCNQQYQTTLNDYTQRFTVLPYPKKNKKKALLEISTVTGRGNVCLQQLRGLSAGENDFYPARYSRLQLVCDMEKPVNIKKTVQFSMAVWRSL